MQQEIITVNEQTYIINAFVGRKGFKVLTKLTKIASPVIGELTKSGGDVDELTTADIDIGKVLASLFESGSDDVVDLIFELVEDVQKDGVKINIDKEFSLNYASLVELALAVAKFNYKDVFQKLGMNLG